MCRNVQMLPKIVQQKHMILLANSPTVLSTITTSETLSDVKGSVTGVGSYSGDNDTDKYCLEIHSTVKGEKCA